jgi:hypothetical protein
MNSSDKQVSISVRRQGLFQFLIGLLVFAVVLAILVLLSQYVSNLVIPIGLLLPGAYALAGLVQFITGVPFFELARRWDSLKGWQRGVFGTFIVLVGGALVAGIIGSIGYWASHQ